MLNLSLSQTNYLQNVQCSVWGQCSRKYMYETHIVMCIIWSRFSYDHFSFHVNLVICMDCSYWFKS